MRPWFYYVLLLFQFCLPLRANAHDDSLSYEQWRVLYSQVLDSFEEAFIPSNELKQAATQSVKVGNHYYKINTSPMQMALLQLSQELRTLYPEKCEPNQTCEIEPLPYNLSLTLEKLNPKSAPQKLIKLFSHLLPNVRELSKFGARELGHLGLGGMFFVSVIQVLWEWIETVVSPVGHWACTAVNVALLIQAKSFLQAGPALCAKGVSPNFSNRLKASLAALKIGFKHSYLIRQTILDRQTQLTLEQRSKWTQIFLFYVNALSKNKKVQSPSPIDHIFSGLSLPNFYGPEISSTQNESGVMPINKIELATALEKEIEQIINPNLPHHERLYRTHLVEMVIEIPIMILENQLDTLEEQEYLSYRRGLNWRHLIGVLKQTYRELSTSLIVEATHDLASQESRNERIRYYHLSIKNILDELKYLEIALAQETSKENPKPDLMPMKKRFHHVRKTFKATRLGHTKCLKELDQS